VLVPVLTELALPTTPPGVAGVFAGGGGSTLGRFASDTVESSWARSSCEMAALSIVCSASSRQLESESPRRLTAAALDQIGRSDGADDDELVTHMSGEYQRRRFRSARTVADRNPGSLGRRTAGGRSTHSRGDGKT